ncbi:MAG: EMC3/TMCO1 family protein [Promethearchaeota archaeon]
MLKQPEKKKKKYKLQKKNRVNVKKLIMIFGSLSVYIAMIIIFSSIDSIPGGLQFKFFIQQPPGTTLFIIGFSLIINLCSAILGRSLIDSKELQRRMKLIKDHNKEKKDLEKLKSSNFKLYQKKLIKVKRKEASIKKMTQSISLQRMKPSCVTFLPMIILFFFIRTLFKIDHAADLSSGAIWFDIAAGGEVGIARMVMNPFPELNFLSGYLFPQPDLYYWGGQGYIGFTAFYFLCSFALNSLIQRLTGLSTGGMGGGMGGFGGLGGMDSLK